MKDYMTGSELRQHLHISTRKMKYLMDHNYIPHENTGKATHKYRILRSDVEAFKLRMEKDKKLQAQLAGQFSSRPKKLPQPRSPIDSDNLKEFLIRRWKSMPEALLIDQAAQMIGANRNSILRLGHIGVIEIVVIMGKRYCAKENFIEYLIRPEVTLRPQIGNYKEIIGEFKKQQYRVRENEVRRQRRAAERVK